MRTVRYVLPLCMLFIIAGCVTDKLLVFEKGLLSSDEMKPLLGKYVWTDLTEPDNGTTAKVGNGKLVLEERGPRYHFSMEGDIEDKHVEYEGFVVLSKIPDSKSGLLALASPKLTNPKDEDDGLQNFFMIMKRDKDKLYGWLLFDSAPVAKGRFSDKAGKFKASEVKTFLEKYADAYVLANPPNYTFKKN